MRHWFRSRETVAGARKGRAEILHWTLISVLNGKFWISWECLFEFFWFVYMIFFGCDDEKNQHVRLSARLVGYQNMGTTKCEHTNPFLLNQNVGNFRRWTNFWNPIKQMPNFFLAHPHLGRANYGSQRIKPWIYLWKLWFLVNGIEDEPRSFWGEKFTCGPIPPTALRQHEFPIKFKHHGGMNFQLNLSLLIRWFRYCIPVSHL